MPRWEKTPHIKITVRCKDCRESFTARITPGGTPRKFCSEQCARRFAYKATKSRNEANPRPQPETRVKSPPAEAIPEQIERLTAEQRAMRHVRYEDEPNIPAADGMRLAWR